MKQALLVPAVTAILVAGSAPLARAEETQATVRAFAAEIVTEQDVMKLLYDLAPNGPHVPHYGEIAAAIAQASTHDPLFPWMKSGAKRTACMLVAVAWEESNFHQSAIGDNGHSFGLYQIQPPTARVPVKLLTIPRDASYVAVDLIRQSFRHAALNGRPWHEGLAWYAASSDYGSKQPKVIVKSMKRIALADKLFRKHFAEYAAEPPPSTQLMLSPPKPKDGA